MLLLYTPTDAEYFANKSATFKSEMAAFYAETESEEHADADDQSLYDWQPDAK